MSARVSNGLICLLSAAAIAATIWGVRVLNPERQSAPSIIDADEPVAALVQQLNGDAKYKARTGLEWENIDRGQKLRNEDRVRTGGRSSADILIGGSDRIKMGENALVVIKMQEEEALVDVTVGGIEVEVGDAESSKTAIQFGDIKVSFKRQDVLFMRPDPAIWDGSPGSRERYKAWAMTEYIKRFQNADNPEPIAAKLEKLESGVKLALASLDSGDKSKASAIIDDSWRLMQEVRKEWRPAEKAKVTFEVTDSGKAKVTALEGTALIEAGTVQMTIDKNSAPLEVEAEATMAHVREEDISSIIVGQDEEIEIAENKMPELPVPVPLAPGAGEKFFNKETAVLAWEPLGPDVGAIVEISRSEDFSSDVVQSSAIYRLSSYTANIRTPGYYYWRVWPVDARGERGKAGPSMMFEALIDKEPPKLQIDKFYFKTKER